MVRLHLTTGFEKAFKPNAIGEKVLGWDCMAVFQIESFTGYQDQGVRIFLRNDNPWHCCKGIPMDDQQFLPHGLIWI